MTGFGTRVRYVPRLLKQLLSVCCRMYLGVTASSVSHGDMVWFNWLFRLHTPPLGRDAIERPNQRSSLPPHPLATFPFSDLILFKYTFFWGKLACDRGNRAHPVVGQYGQMKVHRNGFLT